jgi:hypothetical protein
MEVGTLTMSISCCAIIGAAFPSRTPSLRRAPPSRVAQGAPTALATTCSPKRRCERTAVEHGLAHLGCRQGKRARYRGVRKNLFDVRRAAAVQNLETIQRRSELADEQRKAA